MKKCSAILLVFVSLVLEYACKEKPSPTAPNERQEIINYFKNVYHINPDTSQFHSSYKSELRRRSVQLQTDSLIGSYLHLAKYPPMGLTFIEYYPDYRYTTAEMQEHYAIYAIRSNKTGKVYYDYTNWQAGWLIEDYCSFENIDISRDTSIRKSARIAYVNVPSFGKFGEDEIRNTDKKAGIESFLNDEFRLRRLTRAQADSLFQFYEENAYRPLIRGTLITTRAALMEYFEQQAKRLKLNSFRQEDFEYLKHQVNLLLIRQTHCNGQDWFQWIYADGRRLKERLLTISGSEKTFFEYKVEEKNLCF